jgi:hypothetical protein
MAEEMTELQWQPSEQAFWNIRIQTSTVGLE